MENKEEQEKIDTKGKIAHFFKSLFFDVLDILKWAVIVAIAVVFVTKVFILNAIIPSSSMEPTVPVGSLMLCLRTDYWGDRNPQRGEIIVFDRKSEGDKTVYTKRVVGVPGDVIEIIDGVTHINGNKYDEPWLAEKPEELDFGPFEVPEGKYFCMGDNRNKSYDCRYWEDHFIEREDIMAKGHYLLTPDISLQKIS